jgi:hypothetical protein
MLNRERSHLQKVYNFFCSLRQPKTQASTFLIHPPQSHKKKKNWLPSFAQAEPQTSGYLHLDFCSKLTIAVLQIP